MNLQENVQTATKVHTTPKNNPRSAIPHHTYIRTTLEEERTAKSTHENRNSYVNNSQIQSVNASERDNFSATKVHFKQGAKCTTNVKPIPFLSVDIKQQPRQCDGTTPRLMLVNTPSSPMVVQRQSLFTTTNKARKGTRVPADGQEQEGRLEHNQKDFTLSSKADKRASGSTTKQHSNCKEGTIIKRRGKSNAITLQGNEEKETSSLNNANKDSNCHYRSGVGKTTSNLHVSARQHCPPSTGHNKGKEGDRQAHECTISSNNEQTQTLRPSSQQCKMPMANNWPPISTPSYSLHPTFNATASRACSKNGPLQCKKHQRALLSPLSVPFDPREINPTPLSQNALINVHVIYTYTFINLYIPSKKKKQQQQQTKKDGGRLHMMTYPPASMQPSSIPKGNVNSNSSNNEKKADRNKQETRPGAVEFGNRTESSCHVTTNGATTSSSRYLLQRTISNSEMTSPEISPHYMIGDIGDNDTSSTPQFTTTVSNRSELHTNSNANSDLTKRQSNTQHHLWDDSNIVNPKMNAAKSQPLFLSTGATIDAVTSQRISTCNNSTHSQKQSLTRPLISLETKNSVSHVPRMCQLSPNIFNTYGQDGVARPSLINLSSTSNITLSSNRTSSFSLSPAQTTRLDTHHLPSTQGSHHYSFVCPIPKSTRDITCADSPYLDHQLLNKRATVSSSFNAAHLNNTVDQKQCRPRRRRNSTASANLELLRKNSYFDFEYSPNERGAKKHNQTSQADHHQTLPQNTAFHLSLRNSVQRSMSSSPENVLVQQVTTTHTYKKKIIWCQNTIIIYWYYFFV
ncbi:hypothetical protein RFI_10904 [Reticulomyxa filosa]|uniref:Uncharacterized protein n=1 Tax=Reticulomyxa filosa TaxID=46433 RepID=X6NJS5_RETFI|nr:hypothetical protein RFI_10904 [Reticulomyxa filosa]|eukprot:ETO26236.1 hypothetical protein RFI_10904 [Reticulomyxa filosa]